MGGQAERYEPWAQQRPSSPKKSLVTQTLSVLSAIYKTKRP